jgi:hypothetical protein
MINWSKCDRFPQNANITASGKIDIMYRAWEPSGNVIWGKLSVKSIKPKANSA